MNELSNVLQTFAFIACGGLLFGYIIGVNSDIITTGQLRCAENHIGLVGAWSSWGYKQCYELSYLEEGVLSSLNLIGALISSLICFCNADKFGRKSQMQLAALLYMTGGLLAALCPVLLGTFAGLLIYGLGVGFAMNAAPVYIAEISPANVRGALVSGNEASFVVGILLGFVSGYGFSTMTMYGWRFMILLASGVAFIMLLGISFLHESPRFLVLKIIHADGSNKDLHKTCEEAKLAAITALAFFKHASSEEAAEELQLLIKTTLISSSQMDKKQGETQMLLGTKRSSFFSCAKLLVVGCGLAFFQHFTGQPAIMSYATNIFKLAGFDNTAEKQTLFVGLAKVLATLFSMCYVDNVGRRVLLLIGISIMVMALILLVISFLKLDCTVPHMSVHACNQSDLILPAGWAWSMLIALMFYVIGYQVGFGPLFWLLISEIFPLNVRGSATSLVIFFNFGCNIGMTMFQPLLMEVMTPAGLFIAYLGLAIVSIIFVAALVPETKGLSLEQIETRMNSEKPLESLDEKSLMRGQSKFATD